nr:enoyl-CoA hydratase/isomerase family protein [uncultured Comamonas sp.]
MKPSLKIDHDVAFITLSRPRLANKLAAEDLPELMRHIEKVNRHTDIRVLILQSEGKHFCSGYDISDIKNSQHSGSSFGEMVDAFEQCSAVTIAALQGGVYGGATDLVLACDFRVGSQLTNMFMPAARLGLHFYAQGLERYVTRLGLDTAKRLFLTCEHLQAAEMKTCGFLTHLCEPETLQDTVDQLSNTLRTMAPIAIRGMKKHLNLIARGHHDVEAIQREVERTLNSKDLAEGGLAWKEKRTPVFTGQ